MNQDRMIRGVSGRGPSDSDTHADLKVHNIKNTMGQSPSATTNLRPRRSSTRFCCYEIEHKG